jgi:hypothetical protein
MALPFDESKQTSIEAMFHFTLPQDLLAVATIGSCNRVLGSPKKDGATRPISVARDHVQHRSCPRTGGDGSARSRKLRKAAEFRDRQIVADAEASRTLISG